MRQEAVLRYDESNQLGAHHCRFDFRGKITQEEGQMMAHSGDAQGKGCVSPLPARPAELLPALLP